MIKNRHKLLVVLFFWLSACTSPSGGSNVQFDNMDKTVIVGNWKFVLHAENLNKIHAKDVNSEDYQYIRVTLYASNIKTQKSLLFSNSDDADDYAKKYRYLSFDSKNDFYIKYGQEIIYPIGYVFEPSNGLSLSERLVYKFQLNKSVYKQLQGHENELEYWYNENIVGLGKICFTRKS